ncbi:Amidase family protein [Coccidioides posadasii C735 delta SOWgp]|uniref:amidase n=1 Tax=Coccidioides posadasii (strain C735) TaxID=222929 RepID=C5P6F6_COCP7|nr:Amidase family protein [Coccidioides posadasii C735 delta SOWgp]EER27006.1 Amidase family protein [Coccidioides posadasii C735 delta SOWgp]|eukprot:XP_003069151.1 Amidase family protein [Coccidioides posadasii C735 delta SOWgp]
MPQTYKEISAIAQKRRDDAINAFFKVPDVREGDLPRDLRSFPKTSGLLSAEELEIINSDAETLLQRIKSRSLTSVAATNAFCKAAVIAQKLTNCVTEVLFREGLARARYLDEYLAKNNKTIGPLHGLPLSLKDNFITPPHPSSIGMSLYANEPTDKESVLVHILKDLGAVFYVKTNVPTAMMMPETSNRVWGETRNPIHKGLTPGGSSGGEGAIMAMRASPLGVGTDIGGSIRIPSAFCHLYGLKPSFGRLPIWGGRPSIPGQDFVNGVCGPMSPSLRSIKLFCESVLSEEAAPWNYDPKIVPMPWKKDVIQPKGRKLRIGVLGNNDTIITCHPPVERALEMVKTALQDAGHDVFEWEPIAHREIMNLLAEGFDELGSSAIMPNLQAFQEPLYGAMQRMFAGGKSSGGKLGPEKLREMILRRNQLQKDYLDRWLATKTATAGPMDCIITPVAAAAAARLGLGETVDYVGYTGVANLLDLPGCTFPVTYADKSVDLKRGSDWKALSSRDQAVQDDYDPEFYHGAPVSLQLVGRRLEEEKVVEMVEIVSEALKFQPRPNL